MVWTFCVANAFRLAVWWTSNHFRKARAWSLITNDPTLCVRTTGWRLTRICWRRLLDGFDLTSGERISSISWWTATYWIVIDHLTFSIDSTSSWTRISTFLIATSFIMWAFIIGHTLGSTRWRTSYISRHTWANCLTIDLTAYRIWSAWGGLTRVCIDGSWLGLNMVNKQAYASKMLKVYIHW